MQIRTSQPGSAALDLPAVAMEDSTGTAHQSLTPEAQTQADHAVKAAQEGRVGIIQLMRLLEPQRTAVLERLTQMGVSFRLRSLIGKTLRVRYGQAILQVPHRQGRDFMVAHAIQIALYHGGLSKYQEKLEVEEVLGDEDEAEESAPALVQPAGESATDTARREPAEPPESTEQDAV